MVEPSNKKADNEDLPDYDNLVYELEEPDAQDMGNSGAQGAGKAGNSAQAKPSDYVGVHSTSFKDMLLKPELQQSIVDCGFEHPSDVQ